MKMPTHISGNRAINSLKKRQVIELDIIDLDKDAFGVANHEGARILIAGAFPGEFVRARIDYIGKREVFAELERVLRRSPDRTTKSPCTERTCGDECPLIKMGYPSQLKWKRLQVEKSLHGYRSLHQVVVKEVLASPQQNAYQNSAKLVIAGKSAEPRIGILRGKSDLMVEFDNCPLRHPLVRAVVSEVKKGIKKGKIPIYNPRSDMGLLRYLFVRFSESTNKVLVVFVTRDEGYNEMHHLAKYLKQAVPEVAVIIQNINPTKGKDLFGQKERFLSKQHSLQEAIGRNMFVVSHRASSQINGKCFAIMHDKVRELLGDRIEKVVDLYCGSGAFSLAVAPFAMQVIGIDSSAAAIADANKNAQLNGITNCLFEEGDCAELLNELINDGEVITAIIITLPHNGCPEKLLKGLAKAAPQKIILISSVLRSFARDLDILAGLGFRVTEVQPVDMLPHTAYVDCITMLQKIN